MAIHPQDRDRACREQHPEATGSLGQGRPVVRGGQAEASRSSGATLWDLTRHELADRWKSIVIWGVALGALGALYVALYPSMSSFMEQYLEQAPESMRRFFGEIQGPVTPEAWLEMEFLSMLLPVSLPFLVIIWGARTVAGREERKTLDLLLSNPFPRWHLVGAAAAGMAVALVGVLVITLVLTYVAVLIVGVDLHAVRLASALAALWPFCLLFGTGSLLLSTLLRRGSLAISIPAVLLIVMYVIEALAQVSKKMEPAAKLSLFHHLGRPLEGDFPWTGTLAMLAAACFLALSAGVAFRRRDIYT